MKKILLVLLTLVMAFGTLFLTACGADEVSPKDATEGLEYILNDTGKAYTLAGIGTATDTKIVIAKEYNGISVTGIAPDAFSGCSDITEIDIPSGVRTIGEGAFAGCTSLEKVSVPATLTTIGAGAFYNCTSLESITIPSKVNSIGALAFYNCKSLADVDMKGNMTVIADKTFYGCESLAFITFPKTVATVGESALEGCVNLIGIEAPFIGASKEGGANSHLGYLFGSASNAGVPASLKSVRITNANNVGAGSFSDCTSITSVVLDKGVTIIGNSAFKGCTGLTSVTVPASVTNIGSKAFEGCVNLESMSLPFVGASKEEARNFYLGYIFGASNYKENAEYVPEKLTELEITSAKTISSNAFYGCGKLVSVTINSGVDAIGSGAFVGCDSLESMVLPFVGASRTDKIFYFFGYIFGGRGITENEAVVPETLKNVEITDIDKVSAYAFAGCTSIESITLCEKVSSIGKNAFLDTAFFNNEENWKDGVFYIVKKATFEEEDAYGEMQTYNYRLLVAAKENITACTIEKGTSYVAEAAFENCTALASVYIPKEVQVIDVNAFKGCTSLEAATFENAIKGWKAGSTEISDADIVDTAKMATLLCSTTYTEVQIRFSTGK